MLRITLQAKAGQVSAELARHGVAANAYVHVSVEVMTEDVADALPVTAMAHEGRAFDWLADEPDLYSDADLLPRSG